ncbi:hypothetical protein ABK040_003600 [Willaertia magna]
MKKFLKGLFGNNKSNNSNNGDDNVFGRIGQDDLLNDLPLASKSTEQYVFKILDYGTHYNEGQATTIDNYNWSPYGLICNAPKTYPVYQDAVTSYCPSQVNGKDYLIVKFEKPVLIQQVHIYETLGAGSICKISAVKMNSLNDIIERFKGKANNKNNKANSKSEEEQDEDEDEYVEEGTNEQKAWSASNSNSDKEGLKNEEGLYEGTISSQLTYDQLANNRKILSESMEWITLWKGSKTNGIANSRDFCPKLKDKTYEAIFSNIIRIDMDLNGEWSEIDTIRLDGISFPDSVVNNNGMLSSSSLGDGNNVEKSYLEIFKMERFTDLCLVHVASGFEVKSHCGLLASRSVVFKEMIDKLFLERTQNGQQQQGEELRLLIEDDISFECFKSIVEYLYCNSILLLEDNIITICQFAQKYELTDLINLCCDVLFICLTRNNILNYYKITKELNLIQLNETTLKCMKEYYKRISSIPELDYVLSPEDKKKIKM